MRSTATLLCLLAACSSSDTSPGGDGATPAGDSTLGDLTPPLDSGPDVVTPSPGWGQTGAVTAGGPYRDVGEAVVVDDSGATFVVGTFAGTATFGTKSIKAPGLKAGFAAKLDAQGAFLWVSAFGGETGTVSPLAVAPDGSGGVVVAGHYTGKVTLGAKTLEPLDPCGQEVFVARLNASGQVVWATSSSSQPAKPSPNASVEGLAVDAAGNIHVTGSFNNQITLGQSSLSPSGDRDVLVVSLTEAGAFRWAVGVGGTARDEGQAVAADVGGHLFVAGFFGGRATFGAGALLDAQGGTDAFVARLDAASGAVEWAQQVGGTSDDKAHGVAVDPAGAIHVAGSFIGAAKCGGEALSTNAYHPAGFVAQLDASGDCQWAAALENVSNVQGIAVGAKGTVVTGDFGQQATLGADTIKPAGGSDVFVAWLDGDGALLGARAAGGASSSFYELPGGVALDPGGTAMITGCFYEVATFGETVRASAGDADIFVWRVPPP
jgi:hypothetical protein